MANNCLVTKLKATVDNSSLDKIDAFIIKLADLSSYPDQKIVNIANSNPNATMTIHGGYWCTGAGVSQGETITQRANNVKITEAGAYIELSNPYTVTTLQLTSAGQRVTYLSPKSKLNLETVNIRATDAAIDNVITVLEGSDSITSFSLSYTPVNMDVSFFKKFTILTTLNLINCGLTGSITSLAALRSLIDLDLHDNSITGSLENLCSQMNGRTGTMTVKAFGQSVKLNNAAIANTAVVTFTAANNITISVNSTTVATYNGTTWTDANGDAYIPL